MFRDRTRKGRNDGSRDGSWNEIVAIASDNDHVRGIDLMRNFGQHNAVLAGVRAARWDVVVTLDDDLQHPPEAIPALLAALDGDDPCDLVYGTPTRLRHSRFRNVSTVVSKTMLERFAGWPDATGVTDFRAFRTQLRDGFANYKGPTVAFDALLAWTTTSIKHVRVEHAPRAVGRSNYRLPSLLAYAVTMMTVFSARPLRLIGALGALCSAVGVVSVAAVLLDNAATGANLMSTGLVLAAILMLAGAQLLPSAWPASTSRVRSSVCSTRPPTSSGEPLPIPRTVSATRELSPTATVRPLRLRAPRAR